ncbi:MAG: glycine rich domain-containing protein [Bacilli bacterium]|nr:glycine rich domain-containing protein [Bacilli bacterium]
MKRHNTKKLLIIIIVLFISIGFAVLTSNLNVATTLTFRENVWDIHYENLKLIDCSSDNPTLTLDNDKDEITIGNTFDIPTDYIEFSFVVLNAGTIDAVLNQINVNLTTEQQKYIEYSFKYVLDDSTVAVNDKLFAGQGKLIKARFSYKYDINEFSTLDNTSITIGFKYIQPQSSSVTTWNYEYTGTEQVFYVPKNGIYKIEAWGAQGGSCSNPTTTYIGGYGGYSVGTISLTKNQAIYVNVGGSGEDSKGLDYIYNLEGGYNGGGSGGKNGKNENTSTWAAGGGATHLAISDGVLSSFSSKISDLLLVSGGGGGSGCYITNGFVGGAGGGYIGNSGNGVTPRATGGTQSNGGTSHNPDLHIPASFGLGASVDNSKFDTIWNSAGSGGGGGYYGGGLGFNQYGSAGGGSGYIGNTNLSNKVMYCYNCQSSENEQDETHIKTRSTTNVNSTATSNYAKIGNGFAKITFVS